MMPICAKQQRATFEAQFVNKLCNTVANLKKKGIACKKVCIYFRIKYNVTD